MSNTQVGTSISDKLHSDMVRLVKEKGYNSIADFIRDAIREKIEGMGDLE